MKLSLLNFQSLVSLGAAAAQKSSTKLRNLASGSVTRAIIEASGSVALWLQYVAVQIWLGSRLSTSSGADVDSFVADFSLSREPAVSATGTVTFSRTSGISTLIVPYFNADGSLNTRTGTIVLTADNTQTFGVTVDTANAAWSGAMGGYFLPQGKLSVDVPVKALIPGAGGNVQANSISLAGSPLPGITTVTNNTLFSNGATAESDDSVRARFAVFIATRARATRSAVQEAITSVQQGLSYAIIENTLPTGTYQPGFFTVTVDDGSGTPASALLSAVYTAIDTVRPVGSTFTVQAPAIILASVSMTLTAAPGYVKATLQGQVAAAIITYVNGLGIGQVMSYARLSALAFGVPGVSNVSNVVLNGKTSDIGGGPTQVVKATGNSVVIN